MVLLLEIITLALSIAFTAQKSKELVKATKYNRNNYKAGAYRVRR